MLPYACVLESLIAEAAGVGLSACQACSGFNSSAYPG